LVESSDSDSDSDLGRSADGDIIRFAVTIRRHLRNAPQRISGLLTEQTVMDDAKNQGEKDALTDLIALIPREWAKATGATPTSKSRSCSCTLKILDAYLGSLGWTVTRKGRFRGVSLPSSFGTLVKAYNPKSNFHCPLRR
jgi:hypothetical protein